MYSTRNSDKIAMMRTLTIAPFIFLCLCSFAFAIDRGTPTIDSCPEGTILRGNIPPKDFHVYCVYKGPGGYFKHGPSLKFHENGKPKSLTVWKNNSKTGKFFRYDLNGKIKEEGYHKAGRVDGKLYKFNGLGEAYQVDLYKDDKLVSSSEIKPEYKTMNGYDSEILGEQRVICQSSDDLSNKVKSFFVESNSKLVQDLNLVDIPAIPLVELTMVKKKIEGMDFDYVTNIKFATKIRFNKSKMAEIAQGGSGFSTDQAESQLNQFQSALNSFYKKLERTMTTTMTGSLIWKKSLYESGRAPANAKKVKYPIKVEKENFTYYLTKTGFSIYNSGDLTHVKGIQTERVGIMNVPVKFELETKLIGDTKRKIKVSFDLNKCKIL